MEPISSETREALYSLAQLFIGIDAKDVIAEHGHEIPKKFHEVFKEIMNDVNAYKLNKVNANKNKEDK
jgi:hypothetical protein